MSWLARKINKHPLWVSNRLNGKTSISIDDYSLMLAKIENSSGQE